MSLAWGLFLLYIAGTTYLGWLGFKKTDNFSAFAIGMGDMHPFVVGITMAASVASAATFIINPGFIYVHGISALIHMGLALCIGFCTMLIILSFKFRQLGESSKALTMPDWIGKQFKSKAFGVYFSIVNLFALAFVVLIVGGLSIVMQELLGLSNVMSLIIILTFVTGYVFIGGTYAHVFTNTLQGSLMLGVTVLILASGAYLFFEDQSFISMLAEQDKNLIAPVNPESNLFNDFFSVYISGFLIGTALVCQPHILTKALYMKSDKQVKQYLIFGIIALVLFFLLPAAGFYARLTVPADQLLDVATGAFRQDLVMTAYIKNAFPEWLFTVISVVLLAAGMSTLDGLLVSLSTITANDMILPIIAAKSKGTATNEEQLKKAYTWSHVILVVIAIIAFLIALNPPQLLGIFGQVGVYGMAVAAVPPLLIGIFWEDASLKITWWISALTLFVHFFLYFFGAELFPQISLTFANPGVTASLALIAGAIPGVLLIWILERMKKKIHKAQPQR